jgi:hypothetical protein
VRQLFGGELQQLFPDRAAAAEHGVLPHLERVALDVEAALRVQQRADVGGARRADEGVGLPRAAGVHHAVRTEEQDHLAHVVQQRLQARGRLGDARLAVADGGGHVVEGTPEARDLVVAAHGHLRELALRQVARGAGQHAERTRHHAAQHAPQQQGHRQPEDGREERDGVCRGLVRGTLGLEGDVDTHHADHLPVRVSHQARDAHQVFTDGDALLAGRRRRAGPVVGHTQLGGGRDLVADPDRPIHHALRLAQALHVGGQRVGVPEVDGRRLELGEERRDLLHGVHLGVHQASPLALGDDRGGHEGCRRQHDGHAEHELGGQGEGALDRSFHQSCIISLSAPILGHILLGSRDGAVS